ncbi:MAG: dephospho-CoA kinase [Flavobacteriales bacterium]|nr:dephospho-CoA kinase [Flavobacteriales bacterium]
MMVVGLTGGIGSGKTTIAKLLELKGIPVYDSDKRAKYLMHNSTEIRTALKLEFGDEVYSEEGLNREYLAKIVFGNKDKLKTLNSIVHPVVAKDFQDWIAEQDTEIVVKEAAILFESGAYKTCDVNVTVHTDVEERIERVQKRDGVTREQVLSRINNQWTDEQRNEKSDIIIKNNDVDPTEVNVKKLVEELKDRIKKEA